MNLMSSNLRFHVIDFQLNFVNLWYIFLDLDSVKNSMEHGQKIWE